MSMPQDHSTFMRQALEQACIAQDNGELPFGAVIVQNGTIISKGRCQENALQTVLAHAEATAVDCACRALGSNRLTSCAIYCTNEPCPMCAAAIFQAKISQVIIGASRTDLSFLRKRNIDIQALADDSGYDITIIRGVMKQDVLKLFNQTV